MPCDYSKYPKDWKQIRQRILEREGHKCKWCGVPNYALGSRDDDGKWWSAEAQVQYVEATGELPAKMCDANPKHKIIKIILTVAHLDHDTTNNADENLAALCQRCHLTYDAKHHAKNAKATRDAKRGQGDMIGAEI